MSIPVACSSCGSQMKVLEKYAGRRIKCPDCGEPLAVPEAPPQEEAVAFATTEPGVRVRSPGRADDDDQGDDMELPGRPRRSALESRFAFRIVVVVVHIAVAAALTVLVVLPTRPMALFCIVPGVLIGVAAVPALQGRPVTLYVAFAVLMGYVFWHFVSAVNQGQYLDLVIVSLLAAGATWLLHSPGWPSAAFAGVMALLLVALLLALYSQRNDWDDPERIRRSAATTFVMLCAGLGYIGLGLWEASLDRPRHRLRKRRRSRRPKSP